MCSINAYPEFVLLGVQKAVRKLGGNLCAEPGQPTSGPSQPTHLVLGADRRTVKVLLAVCWGALMVSSGRKHGVFVHNCLSILPSN